MIYLYIWIAKLLVDTLDHRKYIVPYFLKMNNNDKQKPPYNF